MALGEPECFLKKSNFSAILNTYDSYQTDPYKKNLH